jgi:hypothetical protein
VNSDTAILSQVIGWKLDEAQTALRAVFPTANLLVLETSPPPARGNAPQKAVVEGDWRVLCCRVTKPESEEPVQEEPVQSVEVVAAREILAAPAS